MEKTWAGLGEIKTSVSEQTRFIYEQAGMQTAAVVYREIRLDPH